MDDMWEEIRNGLDIGDVWDKIATSLHPDIPHDRNPGLIIKGCAAVFLILVGLIMVKKTGHDESSTVQESMAVIASGNHYPEPVTKSEPAGTGERVIVPQKAVYVPGKSPDETGSIILTLGNDSSRFLSGSERAIPVTDKAPPGLPIASVMPGKELASVTGEVTSAKTVLSPDVPRAGPEMPNIALTEDHSSLKPYLPEESAVSTKPHSQAGRLSFGFITSFKNTWLLNQETFDGLKSETLGTTEFVVFPDAGLSLDYSLNNKWLLQADAFLFSNTGQGYFDYIYGHYSRKKIVLRYSSLGISAKYKSGSERSPRSSVNLLAGGYLSFLHGADQKINTDIESILAKYRKLDLGVRLGGEFELHLTEHLSLAPGLSLSLGLTNIYKGDEDIPGYLRRTHNGSIVFYLSFYYHSE